MEINVGWALFFSRKESSNRALGLDEFEIGIKWFWRGMFGTGGKDRRRTHTFQALSIGKTSTLVKIVSINVFDAPGLGETSTVIMNSGLNMSRRLALRFHCMAVYYKYSSEPPPVICLMDGLMQRIKHGPSC